MKSSVPFGDIDSKKTYRGGESKIDYFDDQPSKMKLDLIALLQVHATYSRRASRIRSCYLKVSLDPSKIMIIMLTWAVISALHTTAEESFQIWRSKPVNQSVIEHQFENRP